MVVTSIYYICYLFIYIYIYILSLVNKCLLGHGCIKPGFAIDNCFIDQLNSIQIDMSLKTMHYSFFATHLECK